MVEHAHALQRARLDAERERAALARLALDLQVAAQELGEATGDREAHADSALLARERAVGLAEGDVLVGTSNGLSVFDGSRWKTFRTEDIPGITTITAIWDIIHSTSIQDAGWVILSF